MDHHETPKCSREQDIGPQATNNTKSISSNEILQSSLTNSSTPEPPTSFSINSNVSYVASDTSRNLFPLMRSSLNAIVSASTTMAPKSPISKQPQRLFLQALSKLNESSISFAIINCIKPTQPSVTSKVINTDNKAMYNLSPPDSLTSAPPSYSFVLRQNMATRRRPRLMGTFIPSPSFVQHTPPPTYATAFDIYVDNTIPPPPPQTYSLGFSSMPALCPECGFTGMTITRTKVTLCTHLCAVILCLFCCWICVPLPYVLRSCKDVYHYCANCRNFLGMYCSTNPEHSRNYR